MEEVDINDFNNEHIEYYFKSAYKPLIIRNGAKHFNAIKRWKTDFKYLISKCGENEIYCRTETDKASYRNGQKYKIDKMKFSKYLNRILAKDPKSMSSYMAVTNIRYKLNEIIADVPLCEFEISSKHKNDRVRVFQPFEGSNHKFKLHSGPHLWIAHKDHYEFCHFDPDDSLLCMIDGRKKIRIFSPHFLDAMSCNEFGSLGRTIQSQIDFMDCYIEHNDDKQRWHKMKSDIFDKFDAFKTENVFGYSAELMPGDVLFIPAFWFHQVTSLTTSISINYFCGDYDDESNHFPTRIFEKNYKNLRYWLLNLTEQNKNFKQFLGVISNLEKSIFNTFYKQWHDFLTDEQVKRLAKEVIEYLMDDTVRKEDDLYYEYGDLRLKENLPGLKRNNPYIKIRGLLHRGYE